MLKNTFKLAGLFILLLLSFVYTDKVFSVARETNPLMKEVINYKKENDTMPTEPIITDDEIILGVSGLVVNEKESYKNMKNIDTFDEEKIVYERKLPKNTILNTYKYYIKKGNSIDNKVSIILKVNSNNNIKDIIKLLEKSNLNITFFVDGLWLEKNVETVFNLVNLGCEVYNLGYDGTYDKNMISVTNRLLESITLKDSTYCLNEDKNETEKNLCIDKKMYSITPTLIEPSIINLKKNLSKGSIISYDLDNVGKDDLSLIVKTITSRGYNIKSLSNLVVE